MEVDKSFEEMEVDIVDNKDDKVLSSKKDEEVMDISIIETGEKSEINVEGKIPTGNEEDLKITKKPEIDEELENKKEKCNKEELKSKEGPENEEESENKKENCIEEELKSKEKLENKKESDEKEKTDKKDESENKEKFGNDEELKNKNELRKEEESKNTEEPRKEELKNTNVLRKEEESKNTEEPKKEELKITNELRKEEESKNTEEPRKEELKNTNELRKEEELTNTEELKNEEQLKNIVELINEEDLISKIKQENEEESKNKNELGNSHEKTQAEEKLKNEENKEKTQSKNELNNDKEIKTREVPNDIEMSKEATNDTKIKSREVTKDIEMKSKEATNDTEIKSKAAKNDTEIKSKEVTNNIEIESKKVRNDIEIKIKKEKIDTEMINKKVNADVIKNDKEGNATEVENTKGSEAKKEPKNKEIMSLEESKNEEEPMDVGESLNDGKLIEENINSKEALINNKSEEKNPVDVAIKKEPVDEEDATVQSECKETVKVDSLEETSKVINETEVRRNVKTEIIQLSVEGANQNTDEKTICMSAEEVKQYLLTKIGTYMVSPDNPLFSLREKVKELERQSNEQLDEFNKLIKGLQMLERKQEIFLRKTGVLPKVVMAHASVSADLPVQQIPNKLPESLIKKDLTVTKIDNPAPSKPDVSPTNTPKPTPKPAAKPANIECIDLTDDTEPTPPVAVKSKPPPLPSYAAAMSMVRHPAPLPPRPFTSNVRKIPPKPRLKVFSEDRGIVLQWDMPPNPQNIIHDPINTFEIFGYQEQKNAAINTLLWKRIGSVKAMSLPMACTLTQFVDGNRYHFSIRAVDVQGRCGYYSDAISIVYKKK